MTSHQKPWVGERNFLAAPADAGKRLDHFLVSHLPEASRARIQELIGDQKILVNGRPVKASYKLNGTETVSIIGELARPPLRAVAENIPLEVVYEDDDLAIINKPSGMMVHAGAGATDDERNRGTLVNAILHHFRTLSGVSGDLRPGIVHRLDKETSGLIIVAKNDAAHRELANEFSGRRVKKTYVALVHGWLKTERGTISKPISRDQLRRTRMTTRRCGGREAVTHYAIQGRIDSPFGKFALLQVKIETGRTHQIRVHLASLGHPIVGDTLYGAPREVSPKHGPAISLSRNFLHAAELQFAHPRTGEQLRFSAPLPEELEQFLSLLDASSRVAKRL